ncbi:hypothetical protein VTN31DRAFT_96 [Thermomyces dupontii]|uniref:uncharacterized protein n=1 Tax=Talaromyces thermophilus TaxID=28565 RepID=UPI00374475D0
MVWPLREFDGRAILCARNRQVFDLNSLLLNRFPGRKLTFYSHNEPDQNSKVRDDITPETLRSFDCGSLPPGILELKIGAPLILLRNLDPQHDLCNGTRLTVTQASQHCLEVMLVGGDFHGRTRLLYKVKITSNDEDLPCSITRYQFPVRLRFAMTINKSQGQSLSHVGVDLRLPVSTHGQLYVALSRTIDVRNLIILTPPTDPNHIENIVYP